MKLRSPKRLGCWVYWMVSALVYLACPGRLSAQCEVQKITASDTAPGDFFGASVSLSGDRAIVGASYADCPSLYRHDCGAAYVYRYNGATSAQEQKLTASDAAPGDFFGTSVSLSGDRAIVGAYYADCPAGGSYCGAAYVYAYDGTAWLQQQKLSASDAVPPEGFAFSVSVSGDRAIVGAHLDGCGSAYVYRYDGTIWVQEHKLTASDAAPSDLFGVSVYVSGERAIVGAPHDDCAAGGIRCGAAYVFRYDGTTWRQEQKLTASDAADDDRFGHSVSISGDRAIVGALLADCPAASDCGAAYVYRYHGATWVQEQKLTASDAAKDDWFGFSVSFSDSETALVGAPRRFGIFNVGGGAAYVYRFDGSRWVERQSLMASDATDQDHFGVSVSGAGDQCLVGAEGRGSAYLFALGPDCNANDDADFCDIRSCPASDPSCQDCNANTIPDGCENLGKGDFDNDGSVTNLDIVGFTKCMGGPSVTPSPPAPACTIACAHVFDLDGDADVDLEDYAYLLGLLR